MEKRRKENKGLKKIKLYLIIESNYSVQITLFWK